MVSTLTTQRLFAFCVLLKCRQPNSVLFIKDNKRKQASKLGMSLDSFNKYLNRAIECGLFYHSGNNYQMIRLSEVIEKLNLLEKSNNFAKYLHQEDLGKMSFYQITSWVRECFVLYNLAQQKFQIKKASSQLDTINNILNNKKGESHRVFKKFIKKAHEYNMGVEQYYKCVKKRQKGYIVTGCDHLSSKIGNCKATMNNALNSLVNKNYITREIIKREFKEYDISNASYDSIKKEYGTNALFINYSNQHFIQVVGSKINLMDLRVSPKYV